MVSKESCRWYLTSIQDNYWREAFDQYKGYQRYLKRRVHDSEWLHGNLRYLDWPSSVKILPWASYQIRKIAGCACAGNAGNVFPCRRIQRKPRVSDPGMHHGTCVKHVPWCMSGLLTRGGEENVPGIPGACATAIWRIWQEAHKLGVYRFDNLYPKSPIRIYVYIMHTHKSGHPDKMLKNCTMLIFIIFHFIMVIYRPRCASTKYEYVYIWPKIAYTTLTCPCLWKQQLSLDDCYKVTVVPCHCL